MRGRLAVLLLAGLLLGACDDDSMGTDAGGAPDAGAADTGPGGADTGVPTVDAGGGPDAGGADAGPMACPRSPAAADRVRHVVFQRPYAGGSSSDSWEVLTLGIDGILTRPNRLFTMGRAPTGTVTFTPDGVVGVVAQDDGTLGVFTLDGAGVPTVVHAAYSGDFYAGATVMDPAGDAVWVLDSEWRNIGGGVYRVPIGCDGTLGDATLVAPAQLPYGMGFLDDGRAVLASKDVLDVALDVGHAHLVDLDAGTVAGSTTVFEHADWIGAGFAISANGRHAFLGDNGLFSDPNRLGVVEIGSAGITDVQLLTVIDAVAVVPSPFDDAVLVVSGTEDTLLRFTYDADATAPLTAQGPLTYAGGGPQLPYGAVLVDRGSLEGLVLVAENTAVRRVRFDGGGAITDLGAFSVPETVGAIGVQP